MWKPLGCIEDVSCSNQNIILWIQKIDKDPKAYGVNDLYSKLAKIGLISPRIGNGIQSKFPLIIPANIF